MHSAKGEENVSFGPPSPKSRVFNFKGRALGYKRVLLSSIRTAGITPGAESAVFVSPNMMKYLQMPFYSFPIHESCVKSSNFSLCMSPKGLGRREVSSPTPTPGPPAVAPAWPKVNKCPINVCQIEFPSFWINRWQKQEARPPGVAPLPTSFMSHVFKGSAATANPFLCL